MARGEAKEKRCLETFHNTTFSIPTCKKSPTAGSNQESSTFAAWCRLKGKREFHSLLQPDFSEERRLQEGKVDIDYAIYFFPIRPLAQGETYLDPEKYTFNPTETDKAALGQFKSWVEGQGGKFDVADATFMAVPSADTTKGWGANIVDSTSFINRNMLRWELLDVHQG
ncbi:hypothetical protein BDV98DRAFT_587132 [Pterulicium gracile]|uniref:Uncharacterized protein n=1 Tax=Pterulicium gracile TaxID=1884261 RepID=A0A5C3Q1A7_9AGAR|nr:hypothetical protein BDV98DRAFT_587132 [Pterula gracilis]